MRVSQFVHACVCVWCSVQYVRLLTRSWRLSVKRDSWFQAVVNTWHLACLRLRWIIAHVRQAMSKWRQEWRKTMSVKRTGVEIAARWRCFISGLMCFLKSKSFRFLFDSPKQWCSTFFVRRTPTVLSDEPVSICQHWHVFQTFVITLSYYFNCMRCFYLYSYYLWSTNSFNVLLAMHSTCSVPVLKQTFYMDCYLNNILWFLQMIQLLHNLSAHTKPSAKERPVLKSLLLRISSEIYYYRKGVLIIDGL